MRIVYRRRRRQTMPKVERTAWTERAQRRECWAEEETARAVRDTREVGSAQEWVKMRCEDGGPRYGERGGRR